MIIYAKIELKVELQKDQICDLKMLSAMKLNYFLKI